MLTKDGYNEMPVGKVQPGVAVSRSRSNKLRETKKARLFPPPPAASGLLTTQRTSISLRTVRFEVRTLEVHSVRRGRPQRCRRRKKTIFKSRQTASVVMTPIPAPGRCSRSMSSFVRSRTMRSRSSLLGVTCELVFTSRQGACVLSNPGRDLNVAPFPPPRCVHGPC